MIDRLQPFLALTLSVLIHTGIAFFGDIHMGQSGVAKSGALRVTVASLSQPAAATSLEDFSLAGAKAVESILYSGTKPSIENSESPESTEEESSKVDRIEANRTAPDRLTAKLDTPITKVEKPIKPEPTLEEPELQAPIETRTFPSNITPPLNDSAKFSGSKSPLSKTETTQATDAEYRFRESKSHVKKSGNPIRQIDDLTTDTTDLSQSTDPSAKKESEADTGSNSYFSRQGIIGLAKTEKIAVPVKTETTAIPLYHLIPKPPYPSRSRDLGEEGTVIIAILVGTDGKVKDAKLSKSSGFPLLDGSALATVEAKWRFKPGTRNGNPVESRVRVPIKFSIRNF